MKVLVVGANGQIGKQLVHFLQESDEHSVRAMVRNKDQATSFKESLTNDLGTGKDENTVELRCGGFPYLRSR